jgi:glycosyltransferase involved in cell wall biosynthesis
MPVVLHDRQERQFATLPPRPLVAAIPDLDALPPHSGVGRVLHSLLAHWGDHIRPTDARLSSVPLPLLRNLPYAVQAPTTADVIFLPRLTGGVALRDTGRRPSVVLVHDVGIVDCPADAEGADWLTRWTIRQSLWGLRHATRVIAVSQFSRDRLLHHVPALAGRVTVIPSGVDDLFGQVKLTREQARTLLEETTGHPLGNPMLLYVGSELPRKNLSLLLSALARLKQLMPLAQLVKIGQPGHPRWREQTLRTAQRLGLRPNRDLLVLDDLSDADLAVAYRAAHVAVSPSLYEGFGLPTLEAMAAGTPVVVTNRGALPEIVGEAGWVAEPALEPFAAALCAALTSPERPLRARAAQAKTAGYTWSQAAAAYLTVMREVTAQAPVSSAQRGVS